MRTIVVALYICISCGLQAQTNSCLPEGLIITGQRDLDSFQRELPNCTCILGDVEIRSPEAGLNYSALENIEKINSSLEALFTHHDWAFPSLERIEGQLWVTHFINDHPINGFPKLQYIGGDATLGVSTTATTLGNFPLLDSIMGKLEIVTMLKMVDLKGFERLKYMQGFLLDENISLKTLEHLNDSLVVDSFFFFRDSRALHHCYEPFLCNSIARGNFVYSMLRCGMNCTKELVEEYCLTSTSNPRNDKDYSLFPNPVGRGEAFTVTGAMTGYYSISGIAGNSISVGRVEDGLVAPLDAGLYVVKVYLDNGLSINRRILVQ